MHKMRKWKEQWKFSTTVVGMEMSGSGMLGVLGENRTNSGRYCETRILKDGIHIYVDQ